jgi:hypothetical protein
MAAMGFRSAFGSCRIRQPLVNDWKQVKENEGDAMALKTQHFQQVKH